MMAHSHQTPNPPPEFDFTFDELLSGWNVGQRDWLRINEKTWNSLAVGAMVFDSRDRMLLVQRAAHDSMPHSWEVPGGSVDDEDPTVFHGCLRELWEESGLLARRIKRVITEGPGKEPGSVFTNRTGTRVFCKFCFEVEVVEGQEVKLDPNEHQAYVWATEEEAQSGRVGDVRIPFMTAAMRNLVLESFRLRRGDKAEEQAAGQA